MIFSKKLVLRWKTSLVNIGRKKQIFQLHFFSCPQMKVVFICIFFSFLFFLEAHYAHSIRKCVWFEPSHKVHFQYWITWDFASIGLRILPLHMLLYIILACMCYVFLLLNLIKRILLNSKRKINDEFIKIILINDEFNFFFLFFFLRLKKLLCKTFLFS